MKNEKQHDKPAVSNSGTQKQEHFIIDNGKKSFE